MGAPRALALCQCFGGALDFQVGEWEKAEAELRDAVSLYRQLGAASGESFSLQRLGVLLTARGQLDEAMTVFDEGLVVAERATLRSHCILRLQASMVRNRLAANDIQGAEQWLRVGEQTSRRHGNCVTCNALLLPEAVRVAVALDRLDDADRHARDLEAIAEQFGSRAWSAMASHARGRVQAASGDWQTACKSFREARDAYLAVEATYDAARCRRAEAEALRSSGDEELIARAAELAAEAQRTQEALGAPRLED
jgi:tetratricopeptide (TPR) repeat protein